MQAKGSMMHQPHSYLLHSLLYQCAMAQAKRGVCNMAVDIASHSEESLYLACMIHSGSGHGQLGVISPMVTAGQDGEPARWDRKLLTHAQQCPTQPAPSHVSRAIPHDKPTLRRCALMANMPNPSPCSVKALQPGASRCQPAGDIGRSAGSGGSMRKPHRALASPLSHKASPA